MLPRSLGLRLHTRLSLALVALLLPVGASVLWMTDRNARHYFAEFTQRANAPIAMYMAERSALLADGRLDRAALAELAEQVTASNPSVEVYVLDTDGAVVAQASDANRIRQPHVGLAPIRRFLAADGPDALPAPLLGDDPLDSDRPRPFSVHPLQHDGRILGYVYAVIGGERHTSLLQAVRGSRTLTQAGIMLAIVLGVTALGGSLAFVTLTRRLNFLMRRANEQIAHWQPAPGEPSSARTGVGDDIDRLGTAYDLMATRLRQHVDALARQASDRRELIADISHDLRTPLTTLQGYLETVQLRQGALPDDVRRHIDTAARHATRLERLIGELFELATLDAGDRELVIERFSLLELAHDVAQDVAVTSRQRRIRLAVSPRRCNDGRLDAAADIALVQRVLDNLIDNALRHVHDGGCIELDVARVGDRLQVTVRDDGAGMSAQRLSRLFEPRLRQDARRDARSGTEDRDRAGLGLAIVRGIVALHGGRILVDSAPGRGSEFRFDVAAAAPVAQPVSQMNTSLASPSRLPLSIAP